MSDGDNGVNIFLLCVSIFELLVLQIFFMRGKVKWEGMWVIFVECIAYGAAIISPDEGFVTFEFENGMYIEWLRYAGWILTCPVLLMTLVSMTTCDGTKAPTVRLVPLLVCNLTMVLFGITSGSVLAPTKWYIFGIGVCFGGIVFSAVVQCLVALYQDSPNSETRMASLLLGITFLGGWGIFPCNFLVGHSGLQVVSKQVYITLFVIGDLLSKNAWVAIAAFRGHLLDVYNEQQEARFHKDDPHELEDPRQFEQEDPRHADFQQRGRTQRRPSNSNIILDEISAPTPERLRQLHNQLRT